MESFTSFVVLVGAAMAGAIAGVRRRGPRPSWRGSASKLAEPATAGIDALTGLPDRRRFVSDLASAMASAPAGVLVGVALGEIDEFPTFTDSHGPNAGELAIATLTEVLRSVAPDGCLYRYGRQQFALILSSGSAEVVVERARSAAERTPVAAGAGGGAATLTVSWGLATVRRDPARAVGLADVALYEARENGGNQIVVAEVPLELRG